MNKALLIGFLRRKPNLSQKSHSWRMSQFQIVLDNEKKNVNGSKDTIINCVAIGENADYIFRNCNRGTLLAIEGKVMSNKYNQNFIYIEKIQALTKRDIRLEDMNSFIERYSAPLIKNQIDQQKKEQRKQLRQLEKEKLLSELQFEKEDEENEIK